MAILPIITGADHPALRKKTKTVPKVTKEILKLIKDLQKTVEDADGAGIAAPQVARNERVCLALISGNMTPLINPQITKRSAEKEAAEEGCLSLPGVVVEVPRSVEITTKYLDTEGRPQERKLKHFDARVVQHEVDHLEGVLIVDYQTIG